MKKIIGDYTLSSRIAFRAFGKICAFAKTNPMLIFSVRGMGMYGG